MVDAVTLDFGGSPLADFSMPDASGLVPLSLPEAVPNGNQKPLQQPSPEAVRRFQEAMKAPVSPVTLEPLRRVAEQKSVAVETVVKHGALVDGGEVETMDTPRVSRPMPQTPFTHQRETTHVVTEASPAATQVVESVATPAAQATPVVDKPAMPAVSVAASVVEVPVRPLAVSVAAPVVNEPVKPVTAPVALPAVDEPVPTPIAAEMPRRAAEPQIVVVETVVRHETIDMSGEVETKEASRVSRPVPQTPFTPQRETTHVVAEAAPAATRVAGAAVTPVVDKPAIQATSVAAPVVNEPVRPVVVPVVAPMVDVPVTPVAVPVAAPVAEEPVATPIAAEAPRKAAEPQSVVVETVVRHETIDESGEVETIDMSRVSRPVPQTPSTPQRETTHVATEASPAATQVVGVVVTPAAQATPVVDKPVMPAAPIAVPVVEVPVRPVAVPVAAPVVDESIKPVAAPIAEEPVITPIAAEALRKAAKPQSVVVETVVRPEAKADGGEVETIDMPRVSRSVPQTPFTSQRETTHVVNEASPAATQVVGVVVTPAAQVTPVVDRPAMPATPVAVPVVEVPVTPVSVPFAAPKEPVIMPVAPDSPRRAAEPQSVVVETVVRHETKADGGEVETIETSSVSRPVPPSSFTPQRETTHVVLEASPAATQVAGAVATPAAQVTPVVDRPAIQAAPVAAPVVNEPPVAPVAIPVVAPVVEMPVRPVVASVAAPVADMPVTPVAASVAVPVSDEPVTPVAMPVAAPVAEEPLAMPITAETPRKAAEPQSVVVETVVRHEAIDDGGDIEKMAAPRVPRPVPQTPSTPSREATHVAAKTPDEQETVLQAVPVVAAPPEYLAASVPLREDGISVAAATARTEAIVETVNKMVEAVVGQISVTPSLVKGEGEVHMTLKPTVLDGSDITLTAKDGTLTVAITPATPEAAQSAAAALPRLEAALAEHVAAFHHVSVALVAKKGKTDETA